MKTKPWILTMLAILISSFLFGQADYQSFYQQSLKTNNTGMYILGSWAIVNMASGAVGWARGSGENKYFHQMNLLWNTVNISIAGIALISNFRTDITALTPDEMMNNHIKSERLYLINAGLDVLYIGTGFLLRGLSHKSSKRQDLMNGYGSSLILQGGFLLLFDAAMWGIQHAHQLNFLQHNNIDISWGFNQFVISWSF
jgi:hypothetical protein